MGKFIVDAGSLYEPAKDALKKLNVELEFEVNNNRCICRAIDKNGNEYVATTLISILGLIKLVEVNGWDFLKRNKE